MHNTSFTRKQAYLPFYTTTKNMIFLVSLHGTNI